ncbi:hypothetical protein, partial [Pseudomonas aeruginosa]|uniref:hypothetical protein n=1 Tax=Pseudomonas aeruginosa TaxID=287 RepID=UPI0022CD637E
AQADLDRDALCGAEFVIGHGATPYRNGRVLHSVFAAAKQKDATPDNSGRKWIFHDELVPHGTGYIHTPPT